MSHNYQVNLKWKEGRIGELSSPELNSKIDVATPPQSLKVLKVFGLLSICLLLQSTLVS